MADDQIRKAFVVGYPISQSKSPKIHGFWLNQLSISGSYQAIEVKPEDLSSFIDQIRADNSDYVGGNFTIPHKEKIFKLVDHVDDKALKIGAVNTIYKKDGKLFGTNTDAYGFAANLDDYEPSWRDGKRAVVLGAGGASRAILYALIEAGYEEINLYNRTFERAEKLAEEFGSQISALNFDKIDEGLISSDLFVNTSSLGMNGTHVPELNFSKMSKTALVTDIVYAPLKTRFLQMAERDNRKIADGFGMLLHQAVPGFEHWFGQRPDVTKKLRDYVLASE